MCVYIMCIYIYICIRVCIYVYIHRAKAALAQRISAGQVPAARGRQARRRESMVGVNMILALYP